MNYIVPLNLCQKGEFIFNQKGLITGSPLSHEYYKIYCLLMKKGAKIIEIYYPFLFFSSPKQLMDIIKIGLLAEKNKLNYLDLNITMPDKQKYVLVYRDQRDLDKAYLTAYLSTLKPKNFIESLTFTWLRHHLSGVASGISRGNALFLYYRHGFPTVMKKAYWKKYKRDLPHLIDEIKRRYEFVKVYDNFADFNKKMKEIRRKGKELEKKLRSSQGFEKFRKSVKVKPFIFPMEKAIKAGVLNKEMENEIQEFRKKISK